MAHYADPAHVTGTEGTMARQTTLPKLPAPEAPSTTLADGSRDRCGPAYVPAFPADSRSDTLDA